MRGRAAGSERLARIHDAAAGLLAWCGYDDLDVDGPIGHPLAEDLTLWRPSPRCRLGG